MTALRVEEVAGQEVERKARPGDPRDVGERGEGRVKNQTVERVMANHLRGDGAAEREAVEHRRQVPRTDLLVMPRGRDAVRNDAGDRRVAGAAPEAAIIEEEDVVSRLEKVGNHFRDGREVAGVAMTEHAPRRSDFRRGSTSRRASRRQASRTTAVRRARAERRSPRGSTISPPSFPDRTVACAGRRGGPDRLREKQRRR